jgi:hypothetical protein
MQHTDTPKAARLALIETLCDFDRAVGIWYARESRTEKMSLVPYIEALRCEARHARIRARIRPPGDPFRGRERAYAAADALDREAADLEMLFSL